MGMAAPSTVTPQRRGPSATVTVRAPVRNVIVRPAAGLLRHPVGIPGSTGDAACSRACSANHTATACDSDVTGDRRRSGVGIEEAGVDRSGHELRVGEDVDELVAVRGGADEPRRRQRGAERGHGLGAGRGMGDHLGHHRVVVRRHHRPAGHPAVDAQRAVRRRVAGVDGERGERPGGRRVTGGRILGRQPRLDRVPAEHRRDRSRWQWLAFGDAQLELDEVEAGDELGHRVLHLEAGVHLEEGELARGLVEQELDGAGADVADRSRRGHGSIGQTVRGGRRRRPAKAIPR